MKISVALCTYNGEKYIAEQLHSILNQTVPVDEIIICDDNSTDSTISILNQFKDQFPNKISLYQNLPGLGVNKNFEKAISICHGDFVFLSDQDDIWMFNKVEIVLDTFKKNPKAEAVFSNGLLINDLGEKFTDFDLWTSVAFNEIQIKKPVNLEFILNYKANMVTGATLCIRKTVKDIVFPIPNIKGVFHDEWIALFLAQRNTLFYTTEKLISYRIHSNQQIGVGGSIKFKRIENSWKVSQFVIGDKLPKSYSDYKHLTNNYFRNYNKFAKFHKHCTNKNTLNFLEIANQNLKLFLEAEKQLKKCNPLFFYFRKIKDRVKGKRQIKNVLD